MLTGPSTQATMTPQERQEIIEIFNQLHKNQAPRKIYTAQTQAPTKLDVQFKGQTPANRTTWIIYFFVMILVGMAAVRR
jgi:phage terminase large subunit-like protein